MPEKIDEMEDFATLKDEGNTYFKDGKYESALSLYMKALKCGSLKDTEKATIHKNSAACSLKLGKFNDVIKSASQALEITPNDPKALYRRCQAYEELGRLEEAYRDAAMLLKVEPKNTALQPILKRLTPIIQERAKQQTSTQSRVTQMFNIAFGEENDKEKRLQALNNIIVLAREEAGAQMIIKDGGIEKLQAALTGKDPETIKSGIRAYSSLCKGSKSRAYQIAEALTIPRVCRLLGQKNEDVSVSAALLLQTIFDSISGMEQHRKIMKDYNAKKRKGERLRYPQHKLDEEQQKFVDNFFLIVFKMLGNAKVSAHGRDSALELIFKNITRNDGVGWTNKFLYSDGMESLLSAAGAIKNHSMIPITDQTRMHASLALSKIYDDLLSDKERDMFQQKCQAFFTELFNDDIIESKIEAIEAVSTLLQGPFEIGNMILSIDGVQQIMMALANSANPLHQRVAVECMVHSANQKKKCTGMLKEAVPIFKKLYNSADDHVKVRALVGLCKMGSYSGTDASEKPMADGSTLALAKLCRKYLANPSKDIDLRKWATEGLAFLTLDAEIKELIVSDSVALQSLTDLAKHLENNSVYAAVTVYVHLTNSYDVADIIPEMKELAKFAKQHVPEEHAKDSVDFVKSRIQKLVEAGIVSALVALSATDSENTKEQISRVFVAIATEDQHRGVIVQQGGAKALIPLALETNTQQGSVIAAHALAKVAVTMNPETAFPGQRMYEVVRPLIGLLNQDRSGIQNFEALLGLTNLASVSNSVRKRIIKDEGFHAIEHYAYDEHDMIRRAAVECICNLVACEEVAKKFEMDNDRVKLLLLYAGDDEDMLLVKAAAGALATLSHSKICIEKIMAVSSQIEILGILCANDDPEIQQRGMYLVKNMMMNHESVPKKIIESEILDILMAVSEMDVPERQKAKQWAQEMLDYGVKLGLIKPKD